MNIIAWETTRSCPLACKHCRGAAERGPYENELTNSEGRRLLEQIAQKMETPMVILTGGEPMFRSDIWDLATYAHTLGVRCVMSPCGALITQETAKIMFDCFIRQISISLDGPNPETHDDFRGIPGAFEQAIRGIKLAQDAGVNVQINCTVSRKNVDQIDQMLALALVLKANALDLFFLVPTGRGKGLAPIALNADETERALEKIKDLLQTSPIPIRVTCAPQWKRILGDSVQGAGRGCLAGKGFIFVSHIGDVQPCGFLNLKCGNVRENDFDLAEIIANSEDLKAIRDVDAYHGACGGCAFRHQCGGCRARAYETSGDYLGTEEGCVLSC